MARSQSSKRGASISTSTATTTAFTTTTATTTTTTAATPTTLLQHNASKSQQLTQQLPDSSWRMIQTYPAWLILVHKFTYKCQRCNTLQLASCNKKGQPFMARTRIFGVPSSFSTIFCGFKSWVIGAFKPTKKTSTLVNTIKQITLDKPTQFQPKATPTYLITGTASSQSGIL